MQKHEFLSNRDEATLTEQLDVLFEGVPYDEDQEGIVGLLMHHNGLLSDYAKDEKLIRLHNYFGRSPARRRRHRTIEADLVCQRRTVDLVNIPALGDLQVRQERVNGHLRIADERFTFDGKMRAHIGLNEGIPRKGSVVWYNYLSVGGILEYHYGLEKDDPALNAAPFLAEDVSVAASGLLAMAIAMREADTPCLV